MNILVTGAAGFIGSNFVRWIFERGGKKYGKQRIVVLDALTYAGNLANLAGLDGNYDFRFVKGDIRDAKLVSSLLKEEKIDVLVNFAAESHVDRSILNPLSFVQTNIEGTQILLNCARDAGTEKYIQISTDEVYGSLGPTGRFTESSPIEPSSVYSASKAGSDHLALAHHTTYGMNVCVTRCSNNYGPYQFPEKLIPFFIASALANKPLPLYGDGKNVRSWIHVDDHSCAVMEVIESGRAGEVYNIGGAPESERENIDVTFRILKLLGKPETMIRYVEDRLGHDRRYAVDYSKIQKELGWQPEIDFESGLAETVEWYLANKDWWQAIISGEYQNFYQNYYSERLSAAS